MTKATFMPDIVACNLAVTSKKQLLQQLSNMAAALQGFATARFLARLCRAKNLAAPESATV